MLSSLKGFPLEGQPLGPGQESSPPRISRLVLARVEGKSILKAKVSFLPKHGVVLEEAQESLKD